MSFLFPKNSFTNFFIILVFSLSMFAQTNENLLTILVKDQDSNVIESAKVIITSQTDKKIKLDKTNSQGIVTFTKLSSGDYSVINPSC
jgi:hypothetical protein